MVTRVAMIILMQPDLQKAIDFYKMLGLRLKFQLEGAWAEFELAGIKVGLCPTTAAPAERRTGIVFQVDDIRHCYEQLKESITFLDEPREKIHGLMVSIKDPGGNIIDLYQPTPGKVHELVQGVVEQ